MVTRIQGDVNHTFEEVDKDGSGGAMKDELEQVLKALGSEGGKGFTADELERFYGEPILDGDGVINKEEFTPWYTRSEARGRTTSKSYSAGSAGDAPGMHHGRLAARAAHAAWAYDRGRHRRRAEGDPAARSTARPRHRPDEFQAWYRASLLWKHNLSAARRPPRRSSAARADAPSLSELSDPDTSVCTKAMIVFRSPSQGPRSLCPMSAARKDDRCWYTFVASIAWISIFTWPMIEAATSIGATPRFR